MVDVVGEHDLEVMAAENEHPVEALAPDGAHSPLSDGVGTRCPDVALDDPGAVGGEAGIERVS